MVAPNFKKVNSLKDPSSVSNIGPLSLLESLYRTIKVSKPALPLSLAQSVDVVSPFPWKQSQRRTAVKRTWMVFNYCVIMSRKYFVICVLVEIRNNIYKSKLL